MGREAVPPVGDTYVNLAILLENFKINIPLVNGCAAVTHGIFHQRLEKKWRKLAFGQIIGQSHGDMDISLKAGLGQGEVVIHIGQFIF